MACLVCSRNPGLELKKEPPASWTRPCRREPDSLEHVGPFWQFHKSHLPLDVGDKIGDLNRSKYDLVLELGAVIGLPPSPPLPHQGSLQLTAN